MPLVRKGGGSGGGAGLPAIQAGDGGKVLGAKMDLTGPEWIAVSGGGSSGVGDKIYLYNRMEGF